MKEITGNAGRNPKAPRVGSQRRVVARCASIILCPVRGKRAVWVEVSLAQTDAIVLEVMFTLNENHLLWNTFILYLPSIQPLNEMF